MPRLRNPHLWFFTFLNPLHLELGGRGHSHSCSPGKVCGPISGLENDSHVLALELWFLMVSLRFCNLGTTYGTLARNPQTSRIPDYEGLAPAGEVSSLCIFCVCSSLFEKKACLYTWQEVAKSRCAGGSQPWESGRCFWLQGGWRTHPSVGGIFDENRVPPSVVFLPVLILISKAGTCESVTLSL